MMERTLSIGELQPDLLWPLIAIGGLFGIMAFTLIKILFRRAAQSPLPQQEAVSDPNMSFLRILFTAVLGFSCAALLILAFGIVFGFMTRQDVWEFMKPAVLVEAIGLAYYHKVRQPN